MTTMKRPRISNDKEMKTAQTLFWIEEWNADLQEWIRLRNCDYGSKEQAENKASEWHSNEGRFLRVVEIRESVTRLFV